MKVPTIVYDAVIVRDNWTCMRCPDSRRPLNVHHRKPRGMGGTKDRRSYDMRNVVLLCGSGTTGCHGEVESYRALSYDTGWLLRSYDDLDTPLITKDGRRVYLTPEGERTDVIDAASILAAEAMA